YSWGVGLEEQNGYQSMASKVHIHVWVQGVLPEPGMKSVFNSAELDWVTDDSLPKHLERLLVKNDYGQLLGNLLGETARDALKLSGTGGYSLVESLLDPANWASDVRGALATIPQSLLTLVNGDPRIFSRLIRPIAVATAALFVRLTGIFTDLD